MITEKLTIVKKTAVHHDHLPLRKLLVSINDDGVGLAPDIDHL
jgi:hypothetical protein